MHAFGPGNATHVPRRIVLAGNPNCGKSVLFNRLTGLYVHVSNFPGTTVDVSRGTWMGYELVDTPGVYGLESYSDEEVIARRIILQGDVVINVVNATTLKRDLFLTLQLTEAGLAVVVALNMMDEAKRLGLKVDVVALARALGVPVVPMVAITGEGVDGLLPAISEARRHRRREHLGPARRRQADLLVGDVVRSQSPVSGRSWEEWTTHPLVGGIMLVGVLWAVYQLVGVLAAQTIVTFTEKTLMRGIYEPMVKALVAQVLSPASFPYRILVGEFGILTMTVTYALGLLLPMVSGFYLALAILEDSGYLPRVAVLTDRFLNRIGLNGRAVIPMILGFGCVTMALFTTRVLGSRRERIIAAALLSIVVPCSAQLAVITALIVPLGPRYVLLYLLTLLLLYGLLGLALNGLLPGCSTDLLLDLPPLRWPRVGNVCKKSMIRVMTFLTEATSIFACGALGISLMQESGFLRWIERVFYPLTVAWLRLPPQAARAFVMGLVRRDFGAAGLYALAMTPHQTLVAVLTITLFAPCIASVLVLLKEMGLRVGAAILVGAVAVAVVVGGVVGRLLAYLPL